MIYSKAFSASQAPYLLLIQFKKNVSKRPKQTASNFNDATIIITSVIQFQFQTQWTKKNNLKLENLNLYSYI